LWQTENRLKSITNSAELDPFSLPQAIPIAKMQTIPPYFGLSSGNWRGSRRAYPLRPFSIVVAAVLFKQPTFWDIFFFFAIDSLLHLYSTILFLYSTICTLVLPCSSFMIQSVVSAARKDRDWRDDEGGAAESVDFKLCCR
jgi:hypothetical protein